MMHTGKTNICIYCKAEGYENGVIYSTVSESVASVIHGIFSQASFPLCYPLFFCYTISVISQQIRGSGAGPADPATTGPMFD